MHTLHTSSLRWCSPKLSQSGKQITWYLTSPPFAWIFFSKEWLQMTDKEERMGTARIPKLLHKRHSKEYDLVGVPKLLLMIMESKGQKLRQKMNRALYCLLSFHEENVLFVQASAINHSFSQWAGWRWVMDEFTKTTNPFLISRKNILLVLLYSRNRYNRSSKRIKSLNLSHQFKCTIVESLFWLWILAGSCPSIKEYTFDIFLLL